MGLPAERQRFPRAERLTLERDFDRVFAEGRAFHFREIVLRALPNSGPHTRLGLSIGRRHGGSVMRNRIKRLLREAFRRNRRMLTVPCDLAIVPRGDWARMTLGNVEPVFREALTRIEQAFSAR